MRIKENISELWQRLRFFSSQMALTYDNSVDILSTRQLAPLIDSFPYLPYTSFSLRYSSIAYFLNDIIINNRKVVVEFGSGVSTITLSRLINQLGLKDIELFCIEHDKEWLAIVERYLQADGADFERIHLIHAELSSCDFSLNNLEWYNTEKLRFLEEYRGKVDCVLVDGPKAFHKVDALARYPALPFLHDYLAPNCSVFLDDTNRKGEKAIQALWARDYNMKSKQLSSSFTRLGKGASFKIK